MPNSSTSATKDKKTVTSSLKPQTNGNRHERDQNKAFLTIGPALPSRDKKFTKRPSTTHASNHEHASTDPITIHSRSDGTAFVSRSLKEKETNPDRISLDRRGLTVLPFIEGEPRLRLLSLQHNLLSSVDSLRQQSFPCLVFLDVYDNQLERICCLETLENLRVLLLGKNRIKRIEGLNTLRKIEVLDLHGNQIMHVTGLSMLSELKVLNLAGNQIRQIGNSDMQGLKSLQELNLRRNRIKKLHCFADTANLQKLFLSNNELQTVEDMSSVAKSTNLKEMSIDNNPVLLTGDCVSFLVSYLPQLANLNGMQVTEQVRKAAMAWRRTKETCNTTYLNLTSDVSLNARREEVISNARTNWELLRSQTKCLSLKTFVCGPTADVNLRPDGDFILTSLTNVGLPKKPKVVSSYSSGKVPILPNKKKLFTRTSSQDTENSQNTSSSNTSSNEYFRLPPILVPIINKMEQKAEDDDCKPGGSISSTGPNVDSSVSSLPSSGCSSDSEECEASSENEAVELPNDNNEPVAAEDKPKDEPQIESHENNLLNLNTIVETGSNLSVNTSVSNVTIPSNASNLPGDNNVVKPKAKTTRSIRSALPTRVNHAKQGLLRPCTSKPKKQASPDVNRDREQGGDYLIEICGRHLNIYGQAAVRFIDRPWNVSKANDVNTVNFNYTNFNGITGYWCKLKQRFPNADHFVFKETNIQFIGQLNALAEVQGLTSLFIEAEGNPITHKNWESYAVYRLSHWGLHVINGREVTEEEVKAANEEYQSLSDLVLASLPDVLLQPLLVRLRIDVGEAGNQQNAKQWLLSADPALRSVVCKEALQWKKGVLTQDDTGLRQKAKFYMGSLLDEMCNAVSKLRLLDEQWSSILQEEIRNTLVDYSQLDRYMKEKIQELK